MAHTPVPRQFDHERFEVYQLALDFVELAEGLAKLLAPGRSHIIDQLRRAALSIVLNIAEGAGEYRPAEKIRFYRMAARSATDCAAILDVMARLESRAKVQELQAGREILLSIVSMLVGLCRSNEKRTEGQRSGRGRGRFNGNGSCPCRYRYLYPAVRSSKQTPAAQRATGAFPLPDLPA